MTVLVTGGAGYIGSHTCVALLEAGQDVIVYDNFSNSSLISLARVEQITGKTVRCVNGDIRDAQALENVFACNKIHAVIHFAGLKAVGESNEIPFQRSASSRSTGTDTDAFAYSKEGIPSVLISLPLTDCRD